MKTITREEVLEKYDYDRENGQLISKRSGRPTKRTNAGGYKTVAINQVDWYVHRLIWLLEYGKFPTEIDHKDRNKQNNHHSNLREVDTVTNMRNRVKYKNNTTGYTGVLLVDGRYLAKVNDYTSGKCVATYGILREYPWQSWLDRLRILGEKDQIEDRKSEIDLHLPEVFKELPNNANQ